MKLTTYSSYAEGRAAIGSRIIKLGPGFVDADVPTKRTIFYSNAELRHRLRNLLYTEGGKVFMIADRLIADENHWRINTKTQSTWAPPPFEKKGVFNTYRPPRAWTEACVLSETDYAGGQQWIEFIWALAGHRVSDVVPPEVEFLRSWFAHLIAKPGGSCRLDIWIKGTHQMKVAFIKFLEAWIDGKGIWTHPTTPYSAVACRRAKNFVDIHDSLVASYYTPGILMEERWVEEHFELVKKDEGRVYDGARRINIDPNPPETTNPHIVTLTSIAAAPGPLNAGALLAFTKWARGGRVPKKMKRPILAKDLDLD